MTEPKAEYVSSDVRKLNPGVFADSEALSAAVSGAAVDAPTPEERFLALWGTLSVHAPVREYRFDTTRRWRFDFAWPDKMIAAEIEGGTWILGGGRHNRGAGFEADAIKYNKAAEIGWRVWRFTPAMLTFEQIMPLVRAIQGVV